LLLGEKSARADLRLIFLSNIDESARISGNLGVARVFRTLLENIYNLQRD
jgi:hypothetical protein